MQEQVQKENMTVVKRKNVRPRVSDAALLEVGKLPPQAVEVEQCVLGALMIDSDALANVIDILREEFFYKPEHRKIFHAITSLFSRSVSQAVDRLTVCEELKKTGDLEAAGGAYYVASLTDQIVSAANIEYHVKIIQEKYIQRELIRTGTEIVRDSYEETSNVLELLDDAESKLLGIGEGNFRSDYKDINLLVKEAVEGIQRIAQSGSHVSGIPSGFPEIDEITNGWQKGTLLIVAARPGMGKTAFALSLARNIAVDMKKPIAFFSLEMPAIELVTRLISSNTGIVSSKLKKGKLEAYEWAQLSAGVEPLSAAPLYIDDTAALTMFELRAKARRLKQRYHIEMIFVDYLQLMRGAGEYKGNREQEISQISRQLKELSKELQIPIMALAQLSRAVEGRSEKRPQLSDLRESGAIEQDADMVMFIYRPVKYNIQSDSNGSTLGTADILIAKHRNGPTADIRLRFIDELMKFESRRGEGGDYGKRIPSKANKGGSNEGESMPPNHSFDSGSQIQTDIDEDPFG